MKLDIKKGSTSQTIHVFIQDSASLTGSGKTGLVYNSASLTAYYARPRSASVAIALATQTVTGAFSSGGFVELDATNMPGWYRLDLPDAAVAGGVNFVGVHLRGAAGMVPLPLEIQLVDYDPYDAVSLGLSRIDNSIGSRLASGSYTAPPSASDIWANASRTLSESSDSAGVTTLVSRLTAGRATSLDNLDAAVSSRLATSGYTAPTAAPTAAAIRTEIDTNSTKLDVAVSTRLATAGYVSPDNAGITAIKNQTDLLSFTGNDVRATLDGEAVAATVADKTGYSLTSGERTSIAEALLKLDLSTITGEASRSVLNAVRFLRNKWSISGTTLTVTKEDDTATAWTAQVTTNSNADPVTGTDPS